MNNAITNTLVILLSASAAGLGCSGGGTVNIGNTQTVGAELSDYAATWDGYAEAYSFSPDGSDHVRVIIDASGQGTVEIGDAAPLPPATDPNVGYPPGAYTTWNPPPAGTTGRSTALVQGFSYPIHAARVEAARLQLGVDPNDIYVGWCPLQTSFAIPSDPVSYSCLPWTSGTMFSSDGNGGCLFTPPGQPSQSVDCLKLDLCMPLSATCACDATSCVANTVPAGSPISAYGFEIDGALDATGTILTGTLNIGDRVTVHLTRQ